MFPRVDRVDLAVIDVETTGLKWWSDKLFGIALQLPGSEPFYWDVRVTPGVIPWLNDLIAREAVDTWANHNIKFDVHFLREAGVQLPMERVDCTMIRAALINEHEPTYALDFLARKYCGISKNDQVYAELAKLFGGRDTRNAQIQNLHRAPPHVVAPYAKQDVVAAHALYVWQQGEIERQGLQQVHRLERELMPVLIDMEEGGIEVDVELAEGAVRSLSVRIERAQEDLNSCAGFEVNPNPSGSIAKLFQPSLRDDGEWYLADGTRAGKTEGGKASIDADCLRRMRHPAAKMILDLRKMLKTRDTFLSGHILGHHNDGVIHCNYNQTKNDSEAGTGTGRLSVTSPALQQIPSRDTQIASVVRPIFIPDPGQKWLSIDWGQFEQRWFAHYVNDRSVIDRYVKDPKTDFYQVMSDLTGLPRSPSYAGEPNAKQMTLASIFGMGAGKLAEEMGLPYTREIDERSGRVWTRPGPEALAVMDQFYGAVPGIKSYLSRASAIAQSRGHVHTQMGRRLRFPGGQFTHKAGGLILQANAADAMKSKLVEIHRMLTETSARLLLTVHDEINISIDAHDKELVNRISSCYNDFQPGNTIWCRVPIISTATVADNWWESSK